MGSSFDQNLATAIYFLLSFFSLQRKTWPKGAWMVVLSKV
jgi:hypothetical protein